MSTINDRNAPRLTRRWLLQSAAATAATVAGANAALAQGQEQGGGSGKLVTKGRINQSVCRWCFSKTPLDELCATAQRIGLVGIDLMTPADFPTLKKYGLICTMTTSHPLSNGLADPKYQEASLKSINTAIEATAKEGWKNVICFSGNRRGIDDKTGMANCVKALKEIVPVAEKAGITLQMYRSNMICMTAHT